MPGLKLGVGADIVAYEPDDYGATRYALLTDGSVIKLTPEQMTQRIRAGLQFSSTQ